MAGGIELGNGESELSEKDQEMMGLDSSGSKDNNDPTEAANSDTNAPEEQPTGDAGADELSRELFRKDTKRMHDEDLRDGLF